MTRPHLIVGFLLPERFVMQWFKHDSNANTDDKLQNVLLDYGLEGYGLYWYCLELIVNRVDKDNINFELKHDARIIARNTGSTVTKIEEMMRKFVDLGLFESDNGMITCLKLMKRMDTSMTSNQFIRDLITKARNSHDGIMMQSEKVMQEEKRIDKKRIEESRKENTTRGSRLSADWIAPNDFIKFCQTERPDLTPQFVIEEFRDYWVSVPGAKGVKADWFATWRNWVRRQKAQPATQSKFKNKSSIISDEQFEDWLEGKNGRIE